MANQLMSCFLCFLLHKNFRHLQNYSGLLSDESRLRIFWILCHYEECVINLSSLVGMSSPAVSHHLRQLKTRRLIVSHRSGKEVYYKAADTPQVHTLHSCLERLISLSDSTEHQTEVSNDTETR